MLKFLKIKVLIYSLKGYNIIMVGESPYVFKLALN